MKSCKMIDDLVRKVGTISNIIMGSDNGLALSLSG